MQKLFFRTLLLLFLLVIVYEITMIIVPFFTYSTYLPRENNINAYISYANCELSKHEIKELLEDEVGLKFYILTETQNDWKRVGDTNIGFRHITITKSNLNSYDYTQTLCHEMCHIKFCTGNEIYCQFMTFKILYESDNGFLHNCGLEFANAQFSGGWDYVKNYDCSYYISQYLIRNNIIEKGDNGLWMLKNA